ncbi:MAG: PAS domain S-box protein [Gemmataceae bacterium]
MSPTEGNRVALTGIDQVAARTCQNVGEHFCLMSGLLADAAGFQTDLDGVVRKWNLGMERLLGYRGDEVIGRSFALLFAAEEVAACKPQQVLYGLAAAGRYDAELWFTRKDGTRVRGECFSTGLGDAHGRVTHYAHIFRDATRRWADEQNLATRLRQQEAVARVGLLAVKTSDRRELVEAVVSTAADVLGTRFAKLLDLQPDGRSLRVSAGVGWGAGVVGSVHVPVGPDSQAGFTLLHLEPVIFADAVVEDRFGLTEALRRHRIVSGMSVVVQGRQRPYGVLGVYDRVRRAFNQDDLHFLQSLANLLGSFLQRTEAEASLRASEERLRLLTDTMQDAVSLHDPTGRVLFITPSCLRLTGFTPEELLGADVFSLCYPDDQPLVRARLRAVLAGEQQRVEFRCQTKEGGYRWLETVGTPLWTDGRVDRIVCCTRDIEDRKRAELERVELEERLRQSQKMELVGQLAGGIAHDFNNLLTVITGSADLLLTETDASSAPLLREIHDAAHRAAGLTRQLLAFSRRQVLEPQVLDLNRVVGEVEKMLRRLIGEHVVLTTDLAADLPTVRVDPGQIEQVLINLAVNARDAMPDGGQLTIRTHVVTVADVPPECLGTPTAGWYVCLSVADTGCGMPPEVKARIFEPFFTTKGIGKGTGLGLATVFGIVKQSGGLLDVKTAVGAGTTFFLYLPAVEAVVLPRAASHHGDAVPGTETVLVVEDEEGVRRFVRLALEGQGYRVVEAANGGALRRIVAGDLAGRPGGVRRGDAGDERAATGRRGAGGRPVAPGAVHERLFRRHRAAAGGDRRRPPVPAKAVLAAGVDAQGPRALDAARLPE